MKTETKFLPVLPLRGLVLYPKMVLHFDVSRDISKSALNEAMNASREVFVVCQKDMAVTKPEPDDLFTVGVVGKIKQVMKLPNSKLQRVVVEGGKRASRCRGQRNQRNEKHRFFKAL